MVTRPTVCRGPPRVLGVGWVLTNVVRFWPFGSFDLVCVDWGVAELRFDGRFQNLCISPSRLEF